MVHCVNVGIVDNHPLFRQGICQTLTGHQNYQVVAEGACYEDALRIAELHEPQILLLDAELHGGGLKALRKIAASHAATQIVMLTSKQCESGLSASFSAGARGYTSKTIPAAELINAISTVRNGDLYTDPAFATKLLALRYNSSASEAHPIETLTAREHDILMLVAESMTNKEIARRYNIAEKTVKHYMTIILRKMGARNRVEAALITREYLQSS